MFSCPNDAEKAIKKLMNDLKYHSIQTEIGEITGYTGRGRPNKNAAAETKGYKIEFSLILNEEKVNSIKTKKRLIFQEILHYAALHSG